MGATDERDGDFSLILLSNGHSVRCLRAEVGSGRRTVKAVWFGGRHMVLHHP
jgi:hypothetical protein